jgi:ribosomal protein S27AE
MGMEKKINWWKLLFLASLSFGIVLSLVGAASSPQILGVGITLLIIGGMGLFLSNMGNRSNRGRQICPNCGQPVRSPNVKRDLRSDSKVHSCPNCGSILAITANQRKDEGCLLCLLLSAVYIVVQIGSPLIFSFIS